MNSRITVYTYVEGEKDMGFNIRRTISFLYDEQKKEVIAKYVAFFSGPGNVLKLGGPGFKIWLNQKPCSGSGYFNEVWDQFSNNALKQ